MQLQATLPTCARPTTALPTIRTPDTAAVGAGATALRRSGAGGGAVAAPPAKARVRFWLKFRVDYGQSIRVVGGSPALGELRRFFSAPSLALRSPPPRPACVQPALLLKFKPLLAPNARPSFPPKQHESLESIE